MRLVHDDGKPLPGHLADLLGYARKTLQGRDNQPLTGSQGFRQLHCLSFLDGRHHPLTCSKLRTVCCNCQSSTRRSVMTMTESKTGLSSAPDKQDSRCASQAMLLLLPLPALCSIKCSDRLPSSWHPQPFGGRNPVDDSAGRSTSSCRSAYRRRRGHPQLDKVIEDFQQAVPLPNFLPEIIRLEPLRVVGIARAVVAPLVKWQEMGSIRRNCVVR